MLRPFRSPRCFRGTILGLCHATTLSLASLATADITLLSTSQNVFNSINSGEGPFGQLWREERSTWQDLDLLHTSTANPGLAPISTTTKYKSSLVNGSVISGSIAVAQLADPGLVPPQNPTDDSMSLWAQTDTAITFFATEPAQVQLSVNARLDSPEAFYPYCTIFISPSNARSRLDAAFRWELWGPRPEGPITGSFDRTITLPPGSWDLFFHTSLIDIAATRPDRSIPSAINLEASFAIIPAPGASTLLVASLAITTRRRR